MPPHGRADAAVVAAMRQAISEAAGDSTRTAVFVLRRTRQILAGSGGEPDGGMPSRSTLYRLFSRLQDGWHTTGSASTRRSLAGRPEGPFGQVPAAAPGDLMQIDSTPLDVLVRLDSGVTGRVDLTGIIDVATRTVTAAVLRPTTKSADASVLLARTVTPEPMRRGWPQAMRMSESALPFRRLLSIDERLEHAAARPVIIPQVIVFWTQLHRVAAPFGELARDHVRKSLPGATEAGLADAPALASPSGPSPSAASAPRPAASPSRSRSACPPITRSASGTAPGYPGREHHSSASGAAPTSWPPSARHAGSSGAAPSNSSSTPESGPQHGPATLPRSHGNSRCTLSSGQTRGRSSNPARRNCSPQPATPKPSPRRPG